MPHKALPSKVMCCTVVPMFLDIHLAESDDKNCSMEAVICSPICPLIDQLVLVYCKS